jgi:predicted nucleotidyltransferase
MRGDDDRKHGPVPFCGPLSDATLTIVRAVLDPTDVFLAYAYGSRVRGDARPESDLDIGYYLDDFHRRPRWSIQAELILAGQLSDRLGIEVDLRDLGQAPLEWRGRVLEEGVRIYCRDEVQRVNLERDLLAVYLDRKESFRYMHELRLRRFAESGL